MKTASKKIKIQTIKKLIAQKKEEKMFDLSKLSDEALEELRDNFSGNNNELDISILSEKTINEIEASRI